MRCTLRTFEMSINQPWTGRITTSGEPCLKTVTDVDIVMTGVRIKNEFNHTILWINGKCVKYQSCFT